MSKKVFLIALMSLVFSTEASAIDTSFVDFEYSGFMSIGAGRINSDELHFEEYDKELSYELDSNLGLQGTINFGEWVSFTTQVAARGHKRDKYDEFKPQFEWAYLSVKLSPSWKIRGGRLRIPYYMMSDYIDVGFAYPWVRAPNDVYSFLYSPFSFYDGVELFYSGRLGSYDFSGQVLFGRSESRTKASSGTIDITYDPIINPIMGFNLVLSDDVYTLRYSYVNNVVDIKSDDIDLLISGYELLTTLYPDEPTFAELATMFRVNNEPHVFQALGFIADYDTWLIHSEYVHNSTSHDFSSDFTGTYLSIAYQFQKFTPYFVVGHWETENNGKIPDLVAESETRVAEGNELVDLIRSSTKAVTVLQHETSQILGLRYDINDVMAVKMELQRILPKGNPGQLSEQRDDIDIPHSLRVFSLSFDCIF